MHEMPISSFQKIGSGWKTGKGHNYDPASIKLLSDPKSIEQLHKRFQGAKHNFDLYFLRAPSASKQSETGIVTPEWVQENLKVNVLANPSAITIIFVGNTGSEKVPMTPWIIAHRIAHAIDSTRYGQEEYKKAIAKFEYEFKLILKDHYRFDNFRDEKKKADALAMLFNAIGTMRSARLGKITRYREFYHELFAQHLLNKKAVTPEELDYGYGEDQGVSIRFNSLPRMIGKARGNNYYNQYHDDELMQDHINEKLRSMASWIELEFNKILDAHTGKIMVM